MNPPMNPLQPRPKMEEMVTQIGNISNLNPEDTCHNILLCTTRNYTTSLLLLTLITLNFLATLLLHFLSHSTTLFMSPSHTHFQSTSTHYPTTRLSLLYKLATPPTTTHLYLPTCTRAYLLRVLLWEPICTPPTIPSLLKLEPNTPPLFHSAPTPAPPVSQTLPSLHHIPTCPGERPALLLGGALA